MQNQSLPPEFVNALADKLFADKDATEVILQTLEHMVGISTPANSTPTTAPAPTSVPVNPSIDYQPPATSDDGAITERRQRPPR